MKKNKMLSTDLLSSFFRDISKLCMIVVILITFISSQHLVLSETVEVNSEKKSSPPNIIFIIADDLNCAIGAYGKYPDVITPHLDQLAEKGAVFTNAYANSPLCAPSRASFLSGIHAKTSQYFGHQLKGFKVSDYEPLKDAPSFMSILRSKGYLAFGTGKIHHNYQEDWSVWTDFGIIPDWGPWPWDGATRIYKGERHNSWHSSTVHPSMPSTFSIDDQFGSLGDVPEVAEDLKTGKPGYKGWRLFNKPFKYNSASDRDLMPDELNAEWAIKKLEEEHENPFLLCVGFNRPHTPMFAPQEFFDLYDIDQIETSESTQEDREGLSRAFLKNSRHGEYGSNKYQKVIDSNLLREWTLAYFANVSFLDAQIGKIINELEKSSYKDNTYIIVTSDNGYHMGEKGFLFKNTLWREGSQIPFIVCGPDIESQKKIDHPISLIDIYPTLLDWAGISSEFLNLDGESIRPLLSSANLKEIIWL